MATEDPYTGAFDAVMFRAQQRHGLALTDSRSVFVLTGVPEARPCFDSNAAAALRFIKQRYSANALEVMGRRSREATVRSEAAIRLFHLRPSPRLLWIAVSQAFLSGVRSDVQSTKGS